MIKIGTFWWSVLHYTDKISIFFCTYEVKKKLSPPPPVKRPQIRCCKFLWKGENARLWKISHCKFYMCTKFPNFKSYPPFQPSFKLQAVCLSLYMHNSTLSMFYAPKTIFNHFLKIFSSTHLIQTKYMSWLTSLKGVIHKPCGQIFRHFWAPPPLWTISLNNAYVVIWTFG